MTAPKKPRRARVARSLRRLALARLAGALVRAVAADDEAGVVAAFESIDAIASGRLATREVRRLYAAYPPPEPKKVASERLALRVIRGGRS